MAAAAASHFVGKFKLTSSEKFEDYMKALGVGLVQRNLAGKASPTVEITVNGDEIRILTVSTFKTHDLKFTLGKEFEETTLDGRNVKSVVNIEGNKLVHLQKGDKETTISREVDGDQLITILSLGDVVCTRVYKRV